MNCRQRKQRARERKARESAAAPQKFHGDKFERQIPRGETGSGGLNMASERAQKSEVHETTDDASTSPTSDARTPKGRSDDAQHRKPRPAPGRGEEGEIGGSGDVEEDRARLFPDSQGDRDESNFGGPARIDSDEQGNLKN
jgi:hypothetical protein